MSRLIFPRRRPGYHKDELLKFLTELGKARADVLTEDDYAESRAELLNELASRPGRSALLVVFYISLVAGAIALIFNKFLGFGLFLLAVGLIGWWGHERECREKRNLSRAERLDIVDALLAAALVSSEEATLLRTGIAALFEADPRTPSRKIIDLITTSAVDPRGRPALRVCVFGMLVGLVPALIGLAVLTAGRLSVKYVLVARDTDPITYWIIVWGCFAAAVLIWAKSWSDFVAVVRRHGTSAVFTRGQTTDAVVKPALLERISQWAMYIAFINFLFFALGCMLLGGDAVRGKIEHQRYFLQGQYGHYKEVPRAVFIYSKVHLYTVCVTHLGGLALGFYPCRVRKRRR
jgi:hypothetical protein